MSIVLKNARVVSWLTQILL
ncbi:hypothetical protein FO478_10755 [Heyndrickxia coagulans DSM 1 = ATCC 7050]|nr:hypothetical protein [Heyndrickxia coagulans DSM 1 = ATCC 7050]